MGAASNQLTVTPSQQLGKAISMLRVPAQSWGTCPRRVPPLHLKDAASVSEGLVVDALPAIIVSPTGHACTSTVVETPWL